MTGNVAPGELAGAVGRGEPAAMARAITWCEGGGSRAEELLASLPDRRRPIVGITGAPGAGKSTLVNALVRAYRARGQRLAVVAVDPTSPRSGGALLGDRVRLDTPPGDRGVFFRSLASRGGVGGLSDATRSAAGILGAGMACRARSSGPTDLRVRVSGAEW